MRKVSSLKVGVSGVRGIVGEALTPRLAADFAASFGAYVGGGRVVVGRDTRPTGPMFEDAVVAGLLASGCQPVVLGIVPTPTIQIMVDKTRANGGIAITASHNPESWNALKFIGGSGLFLNHNEAAELLDIYNQPDAECSREEDIRSVRRMDAAFDEHKRRVFEKIDVELVRSAGFAVAVDCCSGAGAPYAAAFLEELGCRVVPLFDNTDGKFARKPEPIPENLSALMEAVVEHSCDIGFAQDPDADRIVVVDETGAPVGEQYSVVLAAEHVLSKTPGPVVVNLATTKAVDDVAARYGCPVFHSKIGEINVTEEMLARNAVIGGEGGSGGVIWPAVHLCRDSFVGMALILEMLAERKKRLSEVMAGIPKYHTANRKVPRSTVGAIEAVRRLREKHADLNPKTLDGVRMDWPDKWVLVRPSNTEPVVRVTAEALFQDAAEALADEFAAEIADASCH